MRLRLDALPEELRDNGCALVRALSEALSEHSPELCDALHKALPEVSPSKLPDRAIREMRAQFLQRYAQMTEAMTKDIGRVIDGAVRNVAKSEGGS